MSEIAKSASPAAVDWLAKAAEILDRPPGPDRPTLKLLLTTRIGGMTRESTYLAYAFAEYLEEARRDDLGAFIAANRDSENPDVECTSVLGMDAATIYRKRKKMGIE